MSCVRCRLTFATHDTSPAFRPRTITRVREIILVIIIIILDVSGPLGFAHHPRVAPSLGAYAAASNANNGR